MESSLDDFIAHAHDDPIPRVETAAPSTATAQREQELQRKIAHLEQRIAAIKARHKQSQGWGKLVIGFVLGCGAMFAVSALMPQNKTEPATTTAQPAPAPVVAPPAKIEITPIEEEVKAVPAAVETPPPVEPAAAAEPSQPAPKAKKVRREKPQPAPNADGSGGDLYNPF